ncbi:MAG TPA: glycosyltransferase family 4 protein [Candidatus Aquilonibacter sp.]|nr:glycosyltransferase family 4 protein [Candidatus Aquilonibacter sp.]
MTEKRHRPSVAVVSPFLDKSHGTERIAIEWIDQISSDFDVHIYSQCVEDLDLSTVTWHPIPKLPGPHLVNFVWWFFANHLWRSWDRRVRGLAHDIVYSPGVNCLDADVISVHIVFGEFLRRVQGQLRLGGNSIRFWPRLLHRRLYYRLIIWLERIAYTNPNTILILIAQKTAEDLKRLYGRTSDCIVLYLGLDLVTYNPARRAALREGARRQLELPEGRFALLLVGNDWHKKGIRVLLEAMATLTALPIDLLVAGSEDPADFETMVREKGLEQRVRFLPPRKDVEFYYAAADAYVGPSLEDTFALPPAESMACGLPVIVSRENGTFEIITNSVDGLILDDPTDATRLAALIRQLHENPAERARMGEKAAETARQYTWERNGREIKAVFEEILRRKSRLQGQTLTQES